MVYNFSMLLDHNVTQFFWRVAVQTEANKIMKSCHSFFLFADFAQHAHIRQCTVCKRGRLERITRK